MIAGELRAKLLRQLRGQAGQRGDAPNHTPAHQAPLAWRAPKGWRARLRCPRVAGPGRASRRRADPNARGRAAAHEHTRRRRCEGRRRDLPRCRWAVAGPGRASRRRAERSSRRGRLAGGPPPTGTQSSPARQHTTRRPEHQRSHKQQHTARTARGRPGPPAPRTPAAQHAT